MQKTPKRLNPQKFVQTYPTYICLNESWVRLTKQNFHHLFGAKVSIRIGLYSDRKISVDYTAALPMPAIIYLYIYLFLLAHATHFSSNPAQLAQCRIFFMTYTFILYTCTFIISIIICMYLQVIVEIVIISCNTSLCRFVTLSVFILFKYYLHGFSSFIFKFKLWPK